MFLRWGGAAIVAIVFYIVIFWLIPLAAWNSPLAIARPDAMGCTLWQFIAGFHALFAVVVWAAMGMAWQDTAISITKVEGLCQKK